MNHYYYNTRHFSKVSFSGDSGRSFSPDIVKEIKAKDLADIVRIGQVCVKELIVDVTPPEIPFSLTARGKRLVRIIGTTPVISKEYDSSCMISFTSGFIRQLNKCLGLDRADDMACLTTLGYLLGGGDCVDKNVIIDLFDLGLNYVKDCTCEETALLVQLLVNKQAKTLDIPLYDCVVLFDLRECPSVVEVATYTEYFDTYYHHVPEVKEGFEFSRSKENITCVYLSNLCIIKEGLFTDDEPSELWMQRLFPHKMLTNKEVE